MNKQNQKGLEFMKTETLYKKVGRKYVPVAAQWYEHSRQDQMKVGTFRLTYAYESGAKRYEYDVTPATAPMVAAAMIAKDAMVEAIQEASAMRPSVPKPYTKKQLAAIERFKVEMGGMLPGWWHSAMPHEIADAAIKAVLEWKP
jgi:hypothetical protein